MLSPHELNPNNLIPALPPPPGQVSNFVNPESLWKWNVMTTTLCLFFVTVTFALRTYARLCVRREWLLEDYMTCVTWVGFVIYCSLMTTVMSRHGGIHAWNLTVPQMRQVLYWFNVTAIEYGLTIMLTKLSILMLFRRVFIPPRWSVFDITLRALECLLVLFYVSTSIVKIAQCSPREKIWNRQLPGRCINVNNLLNTSGMFNFVTDVVILLIPVKSVWKLQMKRKKKVQIVAVFTVGAIAPVFSMIGFLVRLRFSTSPDVTYTQPTVLLWGTAEVTTGILCLCFPPLQVLLRRQHYQRGPTQSILQGTYKRPRSDGSDASQIKARHDEVLTSEYKNLHGDSGNLVMAGLRQPENVHVMIKGGSGVAKEDGSIVKTVSIEQDYV